MLLTHKPLPGGGWLHADVMVQLLCETKLEEVAVSACSC
jgi:hypothetical protein